METSMSGLNTLFSTALSGLNAAGAIVETAASNIANMDSAGCKAARVNLASSPWGGVDVVSITRDPSPGDLDEDGQELSNVDLPTEAVNLKKGALLYKANAAVIKAGDEMMGTLLDIFDHDRDDRHR
jgi:flagellar hook-associated protein FlgK